MKRFASQLIFCSPNHILRQHAVEWNNYQVTNFYDLTSRSVETSSTSFFDGIISGEPISLKKITGKKNTIDSQYNYIDLTTPSSNTLTNTPTVFDFGTTDPDKINKILTENYERLKQFNIFEILAGCCFYPRIILGQQANLAKHEPAELFLWHNIDLINKTIKPTTQIKKLS